MRNFAIVASCLAALTLLISGARAEPVKSGPQEGEKVPGPFKPYNVTGPNAGQYFCLYCKNGANPVAMMFARELNPALVQLIKKIDAATAAHADDGMGSFVVFLSDSKELPAALQQLAVKEGIKHTVLATYAPEGPANYHIAKDADATVVLYSHLTVKANHAYRKGEMQAKDADVILSGLPKIFADE
jgi:hypothetical protein